MSAGSYTVAGGGEVGVLPLQRHVAVCILFRWIQLLEHVAACILLTVDVGAVERSGVLHCFHVLGLHGKHWFG